MRLADEARMKGACSVARRLQRESMIAQQTWIDFVEMGGVVILLDGFRVLCLQAFTNKVLTGEGNAVFCFISEA